MVHRIAIANMKGGVGKSTLAVNLAWHFYGLSKWNKRSLLVDLDPQFNASQYMMGAAAYKSYVIDADRPTVWDIFEQASRTPGLKSSGRKLADSVYEVASGVGKNYLRLIPSQLELNYTLKNPSQKEHLLSSFLDEIEKEYDLIIVDCAPTESMLTTATYLSCDSLLIPVKPEYLATIGLPLVRQSLEEFKKIYRKSVNIIGVCFNGCSGYVPEEEKAIAEVRNACAQYGWHAFDEEIPYSRSFPTGARRGTPIFSTRYARYSVAQSFSTFADAFAARIGI